MGCANTVTSKLLELTVLVLVTGKSVDCQVETKAGLRQWWKLADFAHQPVLYLSKNKTAELKYASSAGASRYKNLVRSWYLDGCKLSRER